MSLLLSNPEDEVKEFLPRYKVVYTLIALACTLIVGRLWYLQIYQGEELREYSEKNRVKETKIPAPRGLILDQFGNVLVDNFPGFEATITPQYAKHLELTSNAVGTVLGIGGGKIIATVRKGRRQDGPFRPVRIKDNLSLEEVFKLKLLRWDHPGLNINETVVRHYPLGPNGAQLLGYVSEIAKQQLQHYNQKYAGQFPFEQGDIIGQSGVEQTFERDLRGTDGVWYVEVDARGREAVTDTPRFLGLQARSAVPGKNLILTIDKDVQEAAFKAMYRDDKIGPRIGGVVAMRTNGEILAWVNTPSFDPNQFTTGISYALWDELANDPFKPLRNKIIQDPLSPGSTFKPIVALAALQEKIISPHTLVNSPASFKFGRRIYHDHTRSGHGNITIFDALERSSNVFFYRMGINLGIDRIAAYAMALGLGQRTGIQLPNEARGLIPTQEWKLRVKGEEWQAGENLSNAIGQGFVETTALQMAVAYNSIATDGKVVKPFVVKRVLSPENKILAEFNPEVVRDISQAPSFGVQIDKKTFAVVKEGLRRVANGNHGTARWWKIPGIELAGKTGTTQVRSFSADEIYDKCEKRPVAQRHHGWFIAFAPVDDPQITVAVLAEHACAGSSGGGPVARDIIQAFMQKYFPQRLKIKPTTAIVTPASASATTPNEQTETEEETE